MPVQMRPQHCDRQGFRDTSTGTSVVSTASCALPNKLNVALILPIDFNVEIPKPDVEGNCCSGFPADAGSEALETSRARPWHQGRLIEDMLQPPAGSCSGRQWRVKSSPACQKAASWRSRRRKHNATTTRDYTQCIALSNCG